MLELIHRKLERYCCKCCYKHKEIKHKKFFKLISKIEFKLRKYLYDEINEKGTEITLTFDEDGYPIINIQCSCCDEDRPAVEITLNNKLIHEMFLIKEYSLDEIY